MNYLPTIGLEVHIELKTRSKMFCGCKNDPNETLPNVNICPICLGYPGTLPVINKEAVQKVIQAGLSLQCKIHQHSYFERKNYFYPDLPKGYQISQAVAPLCFGGALRIYSPLEKDKAPKVIHLDQIHLEEDTGRLMHSSHIKKNSENDFSQEHYSLIDFNRAGVPLMELVTKPEIHSGKEARMVAEELQLIFRYLGISNADMEKGEMRVEVNISLSQNPHKLGTKVEIKNLNSLRAVERAANYEFLRQKKLLDFGEKVVQETRGWNSKKGITISQRKKEEAFDYRYFPEPDLPPLNITPKEIEKIKAKIPELPAEKRERFKKEYKLSDVEIEVFVRQRSLGNYFEKVISELLNWVKAKEAKESISENASLKLTKLTANYILTDLQGLLSGGSVESSKFLITPENFAEFISMIYEGEISSKIAKSLLEKMFSTGADPSQIIEQQGLKLIGGKEELRKIIQQVLKENPKPVKEYQQGKTTILQFLVGKVMAKTQGRAEPLKVKKILTDLLSDNK